MWPAIAAFLRGRILYALSQANETRLPSRFPCGNLLSGEPTRPLNLAGQSGHFFFMTDQDGKTGGLIEPHEHASADDSQLRLKASPREFTLRQRIQLFLAEWLGYWVVLLIGRSMRWEVFGKQNYDEAVRRGKKLHRHLLAPRNLPRVVVLAQAGNGGDGQPEF